MTTSAPMLLVYSSDESKGQANEAAFIPRLSTLIKGRRVLPFSKDDFLVSDLTRSCEGRGITQIVTTDENFLKKLLPPGRNKKAKLSNYAGSIIPVDREREGSQWKGEVLVLDPLKQLITVPYGPWVTERYLTKFTEPEKWRKTSVFNWEVCDTEQKFSHYFTLASRAFLSSIDIETLPPNIIRCVGYTLFFLDGTSTSFVIPLKQLRAVEWMRALNAEPTSFKVCQNGKYEAAHFFAYSAPMARYLGDTKNGLHSWMAELPKDLAFVASLFIRNSMYWKDIGDTGEELDLYKYNAIDTWATGEAWLSWLAEAPDWAVRNYQKEFLQVPISHMMEMRGIKRDMKKLEEVATAGAIQLDGMLDELAKMTGTPGFNPSSPKQVVKLLRVLGNKMPDMGRDKISSNEKVLQSDMLKHPFNERILGRILDYRGLRKLQGTYLTTGENAKEFKGRILTSINPDGTDTGRSASKEHHFWCGLNLQNIPTEQTGKEVKETLVADDGYEIFEIDKSQAEARGVAYCSGDPRLLEAVNGPHDFHSLNASAFFGVPYAEIYDDATGKTLNKDLRNLSKRVNHGANYNMGPGVLLQTMGEKNVRKAQMLLALPRNWTLFKVCEYLLNRYELTYPRVKGTYYTKIKRDVLSTRMLVGPTGWTRYCFGDPVKNKLDFNSLIAHVTQSLNAMDLNMCTVSAFNWIRKENLWQIIQLFAQIHDSIFGQNKIGHRERVYELSRLMLNPIQVVDCVGVERTMIVPVDVKFSGKAWAGGD